MPQSPAYEVAIGHLLAFRPEVVEATGQAMAADPDDIIPKAMRAYLGLMSSERRDAMSAWRYVQPLSGRNDAEKRHLAAIKAWVEGDWHAASRILDEQLADNPRDFLALAVGHQLDFFLGEAGNLRDRVERSLVHLEADHPLRGYVRGMQAFGLEECGDYGLAEAAGREALDLNADDVWANHAVAHVMEMQGRVADGIAFLDARRPHWFGDNLLNIHTSWHRAIFALEQETPAEALALFDEVMTGEDALAGALPMADSTSLLWRLHLDDVDVGGRWALLADAWAEKDITPWYVFNDLHALMAFIGSDRMEGARALVARQEDLMHAAGTRGTNPLAVASAGLAVARGLLAFGEKDYGAAVTHLAPVRHQLSIFGGSHAQRDVFQRTLLVAAVRAGQNTLARNLCHERLALRPASVWAGLRLKEVGA